MARRGRRDRYLNAPQASDDKFRSTQAEIEQDGAMKIGRILLQTVLKVAILSAFSVCCVSNSSAADTYVYKDIKSPNGHPRDAAAKQADFAACGIPPEGVSASLFPKFNKCVRAGVLTTTP